MNFAAIPRTALAVGLLLTGCSQPAPPQSTAALAIDIPELCSKCVEVLRCGDSPGQTVYVLHEKDSLAQVATIFDYAAGFFRQKTEDFRDLSVYELPADGATPPKARNGLKARLDVINRRVDLPDAVVVQKTGAWLSLTGAQRGTCSHLGRAEGIALARTMAAASP